jgi:hypothetical protein
MTSAVIFSALLGLLLTTSASAQQGGFPANGHSSNGNGTVVIQLNVAPSPWHQSAVKEKLLTHLSRKANGTLIRIEDYSPNADYYSTDSLVESAERLGAKFIVTCNIDSERLERRKTFNFPLFFHKYQTVGVVEGEMRIVDVRRKKVVLAKPFKHELNGPRIFQGSPDDDKNDPDLAISAVEKSAFLGKLEDQTVAQLAETIQQYTRAR